MQQLFTKASHLIEALPYIRRFYGKTFVVKCGGAAMVDEKHIQTLMQDIALLHFCGIRMVVVHGGGPDISALCDRLNIKTQFSNGLRVTDAETMEIVQMVLMGKTNRALVTALNQLGVKAVGLSGQDAACLQVVKAGSTASDSTTNAQTESVDLGYVGEIKAIDPSFINTLLSASFLPVIAPIGVDEGGQAYNINADIAAGAIAGALQAKKLVVLSDVNGVYLDLHDPSTQISTVNCETVRTWLQEKRIVGGMIPKLQACLTALEQGVTNAHILDGKMPHSVLLEVFTDHGVGTLIT
ncbi:MAG TPA: acetylglutamate kinase [Gammaproteobacteria bacterium]|jgi:acetylglutamate kinase|nr:acetylglutamate kinase [Gammaproteobacteria bacterium]